MLSQTVEYALRAMIYLASRGEPALSAERIAAGTNVPAGYLSKVMRDLVVAGHVTSQRGPRGGFILAREPAQITMLDIINAVDPIVRIRECPAGNPAHVRLCALHERIDRALAHVEREFREATLADMLVESHPGSCKKIINLRAPTDRESA